MSYHIIDLGLLPNCTTSHAAAINNSGDIVGDCFNGRSLPFLWSQGQLHALPLGAPNYSGHALDINDFQQIIGVTYNTVTDKGSLWNHDVYTQLPFPGDGARAAAINNAGCIVGERTRPTSNIHAMTTDISPNALPLLPALPTPHQVLESDRYSRPYAINNRGQIVGASDTADIIPPYKAPFAPPVPGMHACLWDRGQVISLGSLAPGEGSEAYGINDRTQIVGRSGNNAFLWEFGHIVNLGPGAAFKINNLGVVIGDTFLWVAGERTPLASLLPVGSGWTSLVGSDISDFGEIVGKGLHNGVERGFLMYP